MGSQLDRVIWAQRRQFDSREGIAPCVLQLNFR